MKNNANFHQKILAVIGIALLVAGDHANQSSRMTGKNI